MTEDAFPPYGLAVFCRDTTIFLVSRASNGRKSRFLPTHISNDGINFSTINEKFLIRSSLNTAEDCSNIISASLAKNHDAYVLTYLKPDRSKQPRLFLASSSDALHWKKIGSIGQECSSFGTIVPEYLFEGQSVLFYGDRSIRIAFSKNLKHWKTSPRSILSPRRTEFDHSALSVVSIHHVDEGIALFYTALSVKGRLCLGAALLDAHKPEKVLWRASKPLWEQPDGWDTVRSRCIGVIPLKESFFAYFQDDIGKIFVEKLRYGTEKNPVSAKMVPHFNADHESKPETPNLKRYAKNPIIEPRQENRWEAMSSFNPAALCLEGDIHLLYRAQGFDGLSVLGYAHSADGFNIDTRPLYPAYIPKHPFDTVDATADNPENKYPYVSGGGNGGCEDPRMVAIDGRIYLIYVAFNGQHPPGVALTSISIADFLKHRWSAWSTPKLISRPNQIQKNWVLFPEKINGKFAIMHSISPSILIEYVDNLEEDFTIDSYHNGHSDIWRWDNFVRGAGAPPIKTELGWLVLYHAMDRRDPNRYKVGAILLDLNNPKKILYRSRQPILEPDEPYENHGLKHGVVYVCGAVIKDDTLFVYYGGSDKCSAVASAPVKTFLQRLITHKEIILKPL